jgi:hypothetical protein
MFSTGQMLSLTVLFGNSMRLGCAFVQLSGALVIFVVGPIPIAIGHSLYRLNPAGFVVSFLRQFVGMIGVLQRPLQMPSAPNTLTLFIVFRGGSMSVGGKLVLLGGLSVCIVHVSSSEKHKSRRCQCTILTTPRRGAEGRLIWFGPFNALIE